MKEIKIEELLNYIHPLKGENSNISIALASSSKGSNGLTLGWSEYGILWGKPMATIYIHKDRYSKVIFDEAEYCSICYTDNTEMIKYFGSVSGKDEDKVGKYKDYIETDKAPYLTNSKVVIIGKIVGRCDFNVNDVAERVQGWYKERGVHTLYHIDIEKVLIK